MYDFLPGWMRQVKDLTAHALWTIYRRICFPCTTHLQVSNAPRFLFYQQKSLVFLGLSLYHSCPLIVFSLNFLSISLSGTVLANSVFLFAFWCKCSPVLFSFEWLTHMRQIDEKLTQIKKSCDSITLTLWTPTLSATFEGKKPAKVQQWLNQLLGNPIL